MVAREGICEDNQHILTFLWH